MSGRTPKKTRTASSIQKTTTEEMKSALKKDLVGHVLDQVSILEFVEQVWGLDRATSQKIIDANLKLLPEPLETYRQILALGSKFSEPDLHQPFRQMARGLLKSTCDILSVDHGKLTTYFWDELGGAVLRSKETNGSTLRIRKPDMLEVHIPINIDGEPSLNPDESPKPKGAPKPTWHEVRAPVEFKKKNTKENPVVEVACPSSDLYSISEIPQTQSTSSTGTGRDKASGAQTAASSDSNMTSEDSARAGTKRSASSVSNDDCPTKKARINVPNDELQLATYALECMSTGNRHYVTGLFIDGLSVKLWYYDRTAAICTNFFNFVTTSGTTDLALALFALSQCNMQQAGFDPYLHRITLPQVGQPIDPLSIVPLDRPERDVSKLCFTFPAPAPQRDSIFAVQKIIAQYMGITGRGTTAVVGKFGSVGEALREHLYVLKMNWQYATRKHEGDIIHQLRDALPGWNYHLPNPVFLTKLTGTELGLPSRRIREILAKSGRTAVSEKNDRDLHVIVTNRYKNIWKAKNVEEFKRIFLECLECHYHAYHTGRVLHRDISENNLMIYQPGLTDKDPNEAASEPADASMEPPPARGILNDFDMAAVLNSDGKVDQSGPSPHHHITGTRPFMACDLLNPSVPKDVHFYRYDLESFLYILMWATAHYNLGKGTYESPKSRKNSCYANWNKDGHALDKLGLITSTFLVLYAQDVRKEWQGLWGDWVKPLVLMFREAFIELDTARIYGKTDYDYATCDGKITFEKFMQTIKATPRGLNPEIAD